MIKEWKALKQAGESKRRGSGKQEERLLETWTYKRCHARHLHPSSGRL
jgi:hypothetical protein